MLFVVVFVVRFYNAEKKEDIDKQIKKILNDQSETEKPNVIYNWSEETHTKLKIFSR